MKCKQLEEMQENNFTNWQEKNYWIVTASMETIRQFKDLLWTTFTLVILLSLLLGFQTSARQANPQPMCDKIKVLFLKSPLISSKK